MQCLDDRKFVALSFVNHFSALETVCRHPDDVSGCGDVVHEPCPDNLSLPSNLHYGTDQQMPVPDRSWPLRGCRALLYKSRNFIWSEIAVREICACHSRDLSGRTEDRMRGGRT